MKIKFYENNCPLFETTVMCNKHNTAVENEDIFMYYDKDEFTQVIKDLLFYYFDCVNNYFITDDYSANITDDWVIEIPKAVMHLINAKVVVDYDVDGNCQINFIA